MQKWQYSVVMLEHGEMGEQWQDEIQSKGDEGWELVNVVHADQFYFFFKRIKTEGNQNYEQPALVWV